MSVATQRDIGPLLALAPGGALGYINTTNHIIKATSTGDAAGTANVYRGPSVDRLLHARRYLSAKLSISVNAVLGSSTGGATASYAVTPWIQDSADALTWADYATDDPSYAVGTTVYVDGVSASSASSTGTPLAGQARSIGLDIDLSRARRYIRPAATITVASTSTGSGEPGLTALCTWIFSGADAVPAT